MSQHPREHEELLAALLSGERDPSEPEAARRLRDCASCRDEWDRLRDAAAELERAGGERRAALAEIAGAGTVAERDLVRATFERLAAGELRARRRRAFLWAAAAALLVAGAWVARRFLPDEPERRAPTWLGVTGLELVSPRDEVPRFESFTWTYTGADGDTFTLRIYELTEGGPEDGPSGEPLLERPRLEETTWTPGAQDLEKLPARILWEVEVFSEFRVSRGAGSARAWLSR
jgi:hypothetical protein